MKVFAVLLAAGKSERFGSDKLWIDLEGLPLWLRSFKRLNQHPEIDAVGIVCQSGRIEQFKNLATEASFVVEGGASRQASSAIGCRSVPAHYDVVLVHDAARAFVSEKVVSNVIKGVQTTGAAFPSLPVSDTIKQGETTHWSTLDRSRLVAAQTPQGATRDILLRAHTAAKFESTDEASLIEQIGLPVQAVLGDPMNIKVTHPHDIAQPSQAVETRIGFGYDIHAFSKDPHRKMWLGGVEFDDRPGLDGHSDADVLIHAIVDALLGAAGLEDIGHQYPNTDPRWKDEPSTTFLTETAAKIRSLAYSIVNIDATVIGERPKVNPRRQEICSAIATAAGVPVDRVSVKATTNEGLGSLGRGEGLAAQAVAMIRKT